jgi:hypothetical protein
MVAESSGTESTIIGRIGIFLFGLYPVDSVEFFIVFVITELITNHHPQQDEGGKSNGQVGQVDQGEDFILPYVPVNAGEKMFDHCFRFSKMFQIIHLLICNS